MSKEKSKRHLASGSLPKRYIEYMTVNGKRCKLFDFPGEFVEHVRERARSLGRVLSLKEFTDEWKQWKANHQKK